ncbi:uncharacterized protein LOC115922740 [Strongylocentrotus purpuratus]|uniref:Uncharacterized protein n=1 Tax=Strongylocentrotus purpuratus TaxID=7668 RepID=A0A7M7NQN9_STRPU|nr:uncharacterized protein LOC115922740 [Strongylocentrotus purpuratus]
MVLLKLMVVEEFEERRKRDYSFLRGSVYERGSQKCVEMFCALSLSKEAETLMKLKANTFFLVQDVLETKSTEKQLRVTAKSKIFERGASFEVMEEVVKGYVSPDVISISEAKKSPNKRRVSICGVVTWASECRGEKRKVRELRMMEDGEEVKVMLWGNTANKVRRKDEDLKLVGMEVMVDGTSGVSIHSSPSTKIEGERISEDSIIACTDDGFPMEIVFESGATAQIPNDFGLSLEVLPVKVQIERDDNDEVVKIVEVQE